MDVRDIYSDRYSAIYRAIYVEHPQWRDKHALNLRILRSLLSPGDSWLDTCCGQGWHFSQLDIEGERVGIDLSAAQLRVARQHNPRARFIEADVLACDLGGATFDLVTNFWGAYCYLDDIERIARFMRRLIEWTAPGGSLYLEVLTPETIAAFNEIAFAAQTGSSTRVRGELGDGGVSWSYEDPGGTHELTSPPVSWFERLLAPYFAAIAHRGAVTTMQQLVATGRVRDPRP